jgi:hypothetical protein
VPVSPTRSDPTSTVFSDESLDRSKVSLTLPPTLTRVLLGLVTFHRDHRAMTDGQDNDTLFEYLENPKKVS